MAQVIADRRDVDFVLHEQFGLVEHEKFDEFNKKTVDMIVSEARNLAIKEILPTQKDGDEGCVFDSGEIRVPESFHKAYKIYCEGEWLAMTDDPEYGGQGMPKMVYMAASEYFIGANVSFMLYNGMTHGAAKLVERFGTDEQKSVYLKHMLSGKWAGTMLLTEPQAGSDVGALTTTAKKNDDGTYTISGNKIFISSGEHNLTENIIHPVLARIEGAPEGTKGISLFLVPKFHVNDDGSLGERNDIVCTGIEEKMGIHGNATCSMTLGGKGTCTGTLLGAENKGMSAMFVMMNEARQFVGMQGFGVSTAAYMYALDYARQRVQGKHLTRRGGTDMKDVSIIEHPDVKRQLLTMKSTIEGMRSLVYYTGLCYDMMDTADSKEDKEKYSDFIEILTPIVKGFITDRTLDVCNLAVQVYGGYGYIEEYPVAQLLRDSRIFTLYEGTNGIQAMDLLGRKLSMNNGESFMSFLAEIKKTIEEAKKMSVLDDLVSTMESCLNKYKELAVFMAQSSRSENVMTSYAHAHPFLDVTGELVFGWMHLSRALKAVPSLFKKAGSEDLDVVIEKAEKNKHVAFYYGVLNTAEFYIQSILPVTEGKMNVISGACSSAVKMPNMSFGSK